MPVLQECKCGGFYFTGNKCKCQQANSNSTLSDRIGGKWDNFGKLRLIHDDFTHDMMITLSGDFPNDEVAEKYLEKIKVKLNTE
jgi:hypothetical protein